MSIFGSSTKYSTTEHHLHTETVKHLISQHKVASLSYHDEQTIELAILAARDGQHKISLQEIHDVLSHLRHSGKISEDDKHGLMTVFKNYYNQL
jgi:hypothetical protein